MRSVLLEVLWCSVILLLQCVTVVCGHHRMIAIGDLHGDLNQTLSVLRLTGVIDDSKHWIAADTILVQLGDILDVGPDDLEIVSLLMHLSEEAKSNGGMVEQLLGNHEIRNFRGDFTAVNADSLARHGGAEGRQKLLSMDSELGSYLRTRNAIFTHGNYLFMHGGLSTSVAEKIGTLHDIENFNSELRRALVSGEIGPLAQTGLDLNESHINEVQNPILVRSILNVKCKALKKALSKYEGIQSVVVGHVPHNAENFGGWRLCDGALIDIDFGMSTWKKGTAGSVAALIIEANQTSYLVHDYVKLPKWKADQRDHSRRKGPLFWITIAAVASFVAGSVAWVTIRHHKASRLEAVPSDLTGESYGTF